MEFNQITWTNETLIKAIKLLLSKTFDLREGEYKRAFLMQLNIFLIISTLLIVKPAVTGLFIGQFGVESLPLAFVVVAVFATILSFFYSYRLGKTSFFTLIRRTNIFSISILMLFGTMLSFHILESWVIYIFYIWVALFAVVSASQFWILANLVFNPREAKRLFGFIGAGAIAGGIFGGYLTSLLAPLIGSEKLLFVSALLIWFCIPITRNIWRENISGKASPQISKKETQRIEESPFRLILKSKHLTYLAGIIGISVIVARLVDYQFNALASLKIQDPDELTAFFGFWFSNFNLISLIIQLFITRRVVGVFGIGTSLFFLPAAVFIGAVMVIFLPSLFSAIIIKMSDASLKQSINKSAVELLALPIPAEIKSKTKTFIDVFVDSVATGIGGIILVLIINWFKLSIPYISIMIIITIGIWFYFAMNVRKEYIKSFQVKIKQVSGSKDAKPLNLSNESVISGLKRVLETGNEKQILWVLQKSREKPNEKLFNSITKLLDNPSGAIRAEALRNLYFYRQKPISEKVSPFITDPIQEVRIAAFEYLLEHNRENSVELMKQFLENPDYKVSGAALISLAGEVRNNPELKKQYELRLLITQKIEDLKNENDPELVVFKMQVLLEAIGRGCMSGHFGFIENGFKSENPEIVERSIKAAGLSMAPEFIDSLISFVGKPHFSAVAKTALIQYGVEILTFLQPLLDDENYKEIHLKIPSIAENISSQQSVGFLFGMLESENALARQEALNSLNNLKIKFPFLHFDKKMVIRRILDEAKLIQDTLSVLYIQTKLEKINQSKPEYQENLALSEARKSLINLLEKRLDSGLERIFKLLGLKFNTEEILSAYISFQSTKPDIRNSSIEFLDNLLDNKLKRVLIPILETTILETISEEALNNLHIHIPNEMECYNMLLEGNDIKIKLAVLFLISHSGSKEFIPLVNKYRNNRNQKVKDFAEKAFLALSE